ncbi:MAG TPA: amidohydrolase family protein [Mycobacteriales bacterium]|nr:amidohydrolase family protein [Mycobacteriales bacterium]
MTVVRDAEVEGRRVNVRFDRDSVRQVSPHPLTPLRNEEVVDAAGGALLPGLHDHHIHLLATARARTSVDVTAGLDALTAAPPGTGWIRAVGGADDVDAAVLDRIAPGRPVRVQHHSGAMWVLNSAGLAAAGITRASTGDDAEPGIERDADGTPTGRLWRLDEWLRKRIDNETPDLAALGQELSALGVTAVTDATPRIGAGGTEIFQATPFPQRIQFLADDPPSFGLTGPRKIVIEDHALPAYDQLREEVADARVVGRAVAVHCVTREALLLVLAVLDEIGAAPGDRIEHAALADADTVARLARLRIAVVTQPGFIVNRGDRYLSELSAEDLSDLYRYESFQAAGVTVVPSSDAPYGTLDPWAVMRAARDRRSAAGSRVNAKEWVSAKMVLSGYLRPLEALHARPRRVRAGVPSDLMLLHLPLADALDDPQAALVARTWHAAPRFAASTGS